MFRCSQPPLAHTLIFCLSLGIAAPCAGEPLDPAASLAAINLAEGFRVELFAHEPDVADPVAIAWDERGRAWVAEMGDYPTDGPRGRIRVLVDADQDGRAESSSLFAEGLSYPASVLPFGRGAFVASAPDILLLEDLDGDGRMDRREVVLTGFGLASTQLRVNGLYWGIDARIYAANGRSGGKIQRPGEVPGAAVDLSRRDLRFDPWSRAPETIAGPSQFGHAQDGWGRRFLSWNTVHIRQALLDPRDLERHPLLASAATVQPISDHGDSARIYSIAPRPRTFNNEPTDHFNASCGLTVEDGGLFPPGFAGNAFVCEPLVGLVHRDVIEGVPGSPALVARRGEVEREFLASRDPWFHPVCARSGPDGALYILDFHREMVEHPEYVREELRKEINFSVGRGHGRILRILPSGRRAHVVPDLSRAGPTELVAALRFPAARVRETAQRLILTRGEVIPEAAVAGVLRDPGPGGDLVRAWALWTLVRLGRPGVPGAAEWEQAVRGGRELAAVALRAARERGRALEVEVRDSLLEATRHFDPATAPGGLLERHLWLGDLGPALIPGALHEITVGTADPWLRSAALSGLAGCEARVLFSELATGPVPGRAPASFLRGVAELLGRDPATRESTLGEVLELLAARAQAGGEGEAFSIADGLSDGLARRGAALPRVAAATALFHRAASHARNAGAPVPERLDAAHLVNRGPAEVALPALAQLLEPGGDLDLAVAAAELVAARDDPGLFDLLGKVWPGASPGVRAAFIDGSLRREPSAVRLATALADGTFDSRALDPDRRERLAKYLSPELRTHLGVASPGAARPRSEIVRRYLAELTGAGDVARGSGLFSARCATCHRLAGRGASVGPDLDGIGRKPREELVSAILDPSQSVAAGYAAVTAVLASGEVLSGVLAAETERVVSLRRPGGVETALLRSELATLERSTSSLMPEGLEGVLSPADLGDLLAYLRSLSPEHPGP